MTATSSIGNRLLAREVFRTVTGAAQLAAVVGRRQFAGTTGYVMLSHVQAGENELVNAVSQPVKETWSVLFWVAVAGNALGDQAADATDALRASVQGALLGWSPDDERSPLLYAGGALNRFESGAVLWEERFSTTTYLRANA